MFRTILVVVALGTSMVAASADSILPPPGQDSLFVTAYFSDGAKTHLVGQKWHGCGQPAGQWGIVTSNSKMFFPAC
jgi:Family of unknown function (DUF6289)